MTNTTPAASGRGKKLWVLTPFVMLATLLGATPAYATPATINVAVSCSADTNVNATPGDSLVFSFASDCTDAAMMFNWKLVNTRGFMDTALPTLSSGVASTHNPGGWRVSRAAGLTVTSVFTGNDGSGNISTGDTIAMITPDSGSATVFHSIKWLGAPPVNSATPTISSHPSSSTKTVGDSLSLSVTATASDGGTLSYQWSKGGANISGANSATYLIPSVVLSDAGSFTVVVTNTAGSNTPTSVTSNAAVVTVAAAPSAPSPSTPSSNASAATTPAATTVTSTQGTRTATAGAIAFSAGSSKVSNATKSRLRATVKKTGKAATYEITGSAGKKSGVSDRATRALAKKRAQAMQAQLVRLGVPKSSITIKTKVVKPGKKPITSVKALY